jgi:hypothetical protein
MTPIAQELDACLQTLDPQTAAQVEKLVRDAMALAEQKRGGAGWPVGYFERTAGSFAGETLERPAQAAGGPIDQWLTKARGAAVAGVTTDSVLAATRIANP